MSPGYDNTPNPDPDPEASQHSGSVHLKTGGPQLFTRSLSLSLSLRRVATRTDPPTSPPSLSLSLSCVATGTDPLPLLA